MSETLSTFVNELIDYIQESSDIENKKVNHRGRNPSTSENFDAKKGSFKTHKNLWTYIYNKNYHKNTRGGKSISKILKNPIINDVQTWQDIVNKLIKVKEQIWNIIRYISIKGTGIMGKSFLTIRKGIMLTLANYIEKIQAIINKAEAVEKARGNNETQRKQVREQVAQAAESRYQKQLRKTQQEKMREIAAERKRVEEENRRVKKANRLLKEEIRRKKALKRTLKAAHAVTKIRKAACKKYESNVNMYEQALERQEKYIARNCNGGCNDEDIDNLEIYKKKVEESKRKQQTAIDNNQCPRTVKLKF